MKKIKVIVFLIFLVLREKNENEINNENEKNNKLLYNSLFSNKNKEEKINNEEQFLRDLKEGNKEFLNNKIRKNTSLLGTIKNILLGCLIFGIFIALIIVVFFYYNQELLKI